jgi:zinc D-Ala-D-Ala carboxypeptidase
MKLSENFTLDELTKSQEAIRLGIPNNTPDDEQVGNLILLCKNILQPIRNHFGKCQYLYLQDIDQQRFAKP